jgi:hypothetical protein
MLLVHIADIAAIPLFALTVYYFYNIRNKTFIEYILLLFSLCGLIIDASFTLNLLLK